MEIAIWVLGAIVIYFAPIIVSLLRSIDGKLKLLCGLSSTDGPDPGFTSYQRISAGNLSAIKTMLEQEINRRNRL